MYKTPVHFHKDLESIIFRRARTGRYAGLLHSPLSPSPLRGVNANKALSAEARIDPAITPAPALVSRGTSSEESHNTINSTRRSATSGPRKPTMATSTTPRPQVGRALSSAELHDSEYKVDYATKTVAVLVLVASLAGFVTVNFQLAFGVFLTFNFWAALWVKLLLSPCNIYSVRVPTTVLHDWLPVSIPVSIEDRGRIGIAPRHVHLSHTYVINASVMHIVERRKQNQERQSRHVNI